MHTVITETGATRCNGSPASNIRHRITNHHEQCASWLLRLRYPSQCRRLHLIYNRGRRCIYPRINLSQSEFHFSEPGLDQRTAGAWKLRRDIVSMNFGIMADLQGLSSISRIYQTLFYRTRDSTATVRELVSMAPSMWACTASLLVDWSVDVLRHQDVGLERFLHSQRESLYWMLDDALPRIYVDQWDPPQSSPTLSSQSPPSSRL
jgi:hypothetical protein